MRFGLAKTDKKIFTNMIIEESMLWSMFFRISIIAVFVYVGLGVYLYVKQASYIYFPDATNFQTCPFFKDAEKIVHNNTRMYYKQNGDQLAVIYHGNAGSACDRWYFADLFNSLNIHRKDL